MSMVHKMLQMAEVGPDDLVYDLGCGDGRIIVTVARRYGARAVGIELDPLRYLWCQLLITVLGLRDQVQRAAVSIPANIAEGYERATRKEYVHFLVIAKGSAGELRCLIRVAQRVQHLNKSKSQKIADQATEISRMPKGLIQSLKQSKH